MRILIIRHGDPDYEHDCLTEKGKREAALLAEKLKKEKIDYMYSSPLGRAKETCMTVAKAMGREKEVVEKDFLRELGHRFTLPSGEEKGIPWDFLPEFWTGEPLMYDNENWHQQPFFKATDMEKHYRQVCDEFDKLLETHGYQRDGKIYKSVRANTDTVALFCHFGVEGTLLSRLFNVPPMILTHHFAALTSSVTTLYTEERRQGKVIFRCCGYGDISHLYAGGEAPSFACRFCEVHGDGTRED